MVPSIGLSLIGIEGTWGKTLLARAKWFRRSVIADFPVLPLHRANTPAHARRAQKKRFWQE